MKIKINEKQKGITLIALVITIIVLLILAGVSIAMLTGDNGILMQASDSKIETAVGTVKEQLKLLQGEKIIQGEKGTPETLLAEGKLRRTVQLGENDKYYMYYALKENSLEGMQGLGKGDLTNLQDVFLIDDDLNVKYIARNGKEYGDKIKEKILEDETEIRFSSKTFSEYISKISGITESEMKFKWMKNQTHLSLYNMDLNNLEDLIFFPNLTSIEMGNMNLESFSGIENCSKLKMFQIVDIKAKDYGALSLLKKLETVYVQGPVNLIDIVNNIKELESLQNLSIYSAQLENFDLLRELKSIDTLTTLNLGVNKIKDINFLKDFKNLTSLNLSRNLITDITPLKSLTKLRTLNLTTNNIKDITSLAENKELMYLHLKGNSQIEGDRNKYSEEGIKALDEIGKILERNGNISLDSNQLGLFNNYKSIDLSYQSLTNLELLDGFIHLVSLNLNSNKLTLEDKRSQEILSNMTNLDSLYLQSNQLTDISAINNLKNLKILYIEGNDNVNLAQIEDIISNLSNLRLTTEVLKTIKNCNSEKINKLRIDYSSNVTEIPDLSKFNNLQVLSMISLTKVKDFSNISNIASLKNLSLSGNNLHGRMPDFLNLKNLEILSLTGCSLWSEDLEKLKGLKDNTNLIINLQNNSIIDATALLELNPSTRIDLKGNVNLSQDSKDKLKARFGNNVTF
ncbi:MAG: leucine-rich repeat domain-containing protein [Clostridia bacterium]|nr:leucine-rich repeat domain-containing protein [Clostridium sp.]